MNHNQAFALLHNFILPNVIVVSSNDLSMFQLVNCLFNLELLDKFLVKFYFILLISIMFNVNF